VDYLQIHHTLGTGKVPAWGRAAAQRAFDWYAIFPPTIEELVEN
jgi:hypothetical protein